VPLLHDAAVSKAAGSIPDDTNVPVAVLARCQAYTSARIVPGARCQRKPTFTIFLSELFPIVHAMRRLYELLRKFKRGRTSLLRLAVSAFCQCPYRRHMISNHFRKHCN
jgi:hypothetical protein